MIYVFCTSCELKTVLPVLQIKKLLFQSSSGLLISPCKKRGRSQTTFTKFGFFWPPSPSAYIFYGMKVYKNSTFLATYPPSSCKCSLWLAPIGAVSRGGGGSKLPILLRQKTTKRAGEGVKNRRFWNDIVGKGCLKLSFCYNIFSFGNQLGEK